MAKKSKPFIQDFLNDLVKDGLKLVLGFIFSTALMGGAGYLLFNTQSEVDEINRLDLEIKSLTAEAKTYFDMSNIYSNGFVSKESNANQLIEVVTHLTEIKYEPHLDKVYVSDTLEMLTSRTLQLIQEKGKISGFSIKDEQIKSRQQTLLLWYDNEIKSSNETYAMIINWEKETVDDRDKRLIQLQELIGNTVELTNKIIVQIDQNIYYIENVKMAEGDRLDAELQGKKSQLLIRKTASWIGVILGLLLLIGLTISVKNIYFDKSKKR